MINDSYSREREWLDDLIMETSEEEEFIESLFDNEIMLEKATSVEYSLRRFKQKYKYDPKSSTIEVDGKRYKVDLNINQSIIHIKDPDTGQTISMARQICADDTSKDDPKIYLDKSFFQLKHDDRRAAILQHEIGHGRLHSTVPGYKYTDTSKISREMVMNELNDQCKRIYDRYIKMGMSKEDADSNTKMVRGILAGQIDEEYLKSSTASEMQSKLRADARKAANKALPKHLPQNIDVEHINAKELEADRYAANRTSEKAVKRGLRETAKRGRKSMDKLLSTQGKAEYMNQNEVPDDKRNSTKVTKPQRMEALGLTGDPGRSVNDMKKMSNKSISYDYKVRSKALKDKDLRNAKALK